MRLSSSEILILFTITRYNSVFQTLALMESLPDLTEPQQFSSSSSAVTQDNNHHPRKTTQLRNWLDLPEELLSQIFKKLGPFDIIRWAQRVCPAWRNLAKQPHLFSSIDLAHNPPRYSRDIDVVKIEKEIIDRSGGHSVSLSYNDCYMIDYPDVLRYAFAKPNFFNSLKFLEIKCAGVDCFMNAATGKLPSLEKLTLSLHTNYGDDHTPEQVIAEIGTSCSLLKYFCWERFSHHSIHRYNDYDQYKDTEVLEIARYMPQLRVLRLERNIVKDKELQALLDGCPNLEHLDLERCDYLTDLSRDLLDHCWKRIKTFSPPNERFNSFFEPSPLYEPTSPGYDPYSDSTSPGHGIYSDKENSHVALPSSPVYEPTSPYCELFADYETSLIASPSYIPIGSPRI